MAARPQGEKPAATARQEVRGEPGLADPRFPVDHDAPELAPVGAAKRDGERAHLGVPADERSRMAVLPRHVRQSMARDHPDGRGCRTECRTGTEALLAPYAPG